MEEIDWLPKQFAFFVCGLFAAIGVTAGSAIADQPESNKGPAHQLLPSPTIHQTPVPTPPEHQG